MTPSRPALRYKGETWTYADLERESTRLAHGLASLGVGHGDRVAYIGFNHPRLLQALFATGKLGAIFVPLNARLTVPELAFAIADSGARVLLHGTRVAGRALQLTDRAAGLQLVGIDEAAEGGLALDALVGAAPATTIDEPVALDDVAIIMYTSGTTGRPKGAMLSHGNISWNSFNVLVELDVASDEVTLVGTPLYHAAALNMTCLPALLKGGTAVLVDSFDPGSILDLIQHQRITWMFGVPAMYHAIAQHRRFATADLSSLRHLVCGGAYVPESLIETYARRGLPLLPGYGMTEASPGVLFAGDPGQRSPGSTGVPSFFTDVRLVDANGAEAGVDQVGEIQVSGPNVMKGYWNQPAATADVLDEEWLRTGDAASVDASGRYTIRDRIKDMYIAGGENVYPAEVEAAILQHPAVADCAVLGLPDARWGELGAAVVVLAEGQTLEFDELRRFLAARLAPFKVPKRFHIVDQLPRSGPGKVAKQILRNRFGSGGGR